jgi:hypothetical protein
MKVYELVEQLKEMPQDFDVCFWIGARRVNIIEVRDCGDVVDLYEEGTEDDGAEPR